LALFSPVVRATDYSSILLSNPYYYVPSNLTLAYRTTVSNVPVPVGDQTLWDISSATYTNNNGTNETIFTGTAIAYIGTTNGSTSSISGTISSSGQVSMNFVANGNTNVGVGQMASYNGATNFLMQTMDGSPVSYDTHWAYMSPTNTLTNLIAASSTTVPTYSTATQWTQYLSLLGSVWSYSSTSLGGTGIFTVSTYTNGYFSGSGVTSGSTNYNFLNSVTPNGTVLFNYSVPGNPYVGSLWGQFSGSNVGATISLATYDSSGNSNFDGVGTMTTAGLVVGFDTNGQTATFSNGLTTNFGSTFVGYTTNGNGNSLTITSNSVVSNSYDVTIGYEGSGNTLTITNGGKLYDRDGYVTAVGGSNNSAVIAGEGSVWSNNGSLYVAASPDHAGTGTVTLLSGGTLAASNLVISGVTNSVGTVEVGLKGGTDSNMTLNVQMITFGDGTGSLGLNQSDTLTISGSIVGATATNSYAMIQQYGSGTTILTGVSHTGTGYRVDGGQLRVDGGIFDIVLSAGASPDELGGPRTVCVGNKHSGNSMVITNGGYVHSFVTIIGTGTQKDTEVLTGTSNNWALVTGSGSQLDAGELLIGNVSSGNSLMISNGATVTCSLYASIGASGSSNSVIIDGAGSLFSNAGSLELGSYSESNVSVGNSILITNGGALFSGSATIASSTNSYGNSVTVSGTGSSWTNSGDLILGDIGAGNTLTISAGGQINNENGWIGYTNAASNNSVMVTSDQSSWNNSGDLVVGYYGSSNSLVISNGAMVLNQFNGYGAVIGYDAGSSNNSVIVTGSNLATGSVSTWLSQADLTIGYGGSSNSLIVSGGAQLGSINGWIGYTNTASNNSVVVTDANSLWNLTGDLTVGNYGSGSSLVISNGATINSANLFVGYASNSIGNLLVADGSGSSLNVSGDLYIGYGGQSNRMVISSGAFVMNVNAYDDGINPSDAYNSVLVTGEGSHWLNSGNLTFGLAGHDNSLVISNGGIVSVGGNSTIGDWDTATNNSVLVTGYNSLMSNNGVLTIGNSGSGTFIVTDGGTIVANGGIVIASNSGSIGTLNIGVFDGGGFLNSEGQVSVLAPTITFGAGTGTINFNQGDYSYSTNLHNFEYHPFILSSDISGNGSLNQLASFGTTILTGSNNYTGVTRIIDGSMEFSGTQSLYGGDTNQWTAANLIVSNNATAIFTVGGTNPFTEANINQLLGNASSTNGFLDGARLGIDTTGTNFTYSSNLTDLNGGSNALSLVVLGTGTLNLAGSNNYTGYSLFYGGTTVVSGSINPATNNGSFSSFVDVGLLNYSGSLVVTNGGSVNASNSLVLIGAFSSVSNSVTVTGTNGPNSSILRAGELFVGSAIFTSLVNLQESNLALPPSSGNSLVISNGGLVVGDNGVNTNLCLVGFLSPSNSVTVTGSNSGLGFSVIAIGAGGSANTMVISNGATVQDAAGVIGGLSNVLPFGPNADSNSVIVTGAGSTWENGGSLAVGGNGLISSNFFGGDTIYNGSSYNSLTISNGATVSSSTGYVGGLNCSNNTATITGSGSVWSNSGTLYVGWKGSSDNSLVVSDGGKLISASAFIGYTNSSNNVSVGNSVLVTGAGSLWINSGIITVGASNSLILANGGTVSASSVNISPGAIFTGTGGIINGNLTIQHGGMFVIQSPSSLTTINGSATLGGSLVIASPMAFGTKDTFLITTGPINGSFDSIIAPAGERARLVIEGDPTASVIIAPASYTQLAANRNQLNVATALNSFIPATGGDQLVVSTSLDSLTASQYNQAFNAIMPTFYQQMATIAFNQANAQNMELNQRLWGVRVAEGGGFSMSGLADNYAMLQEGQGDGGKSVLDSKKDILRPGLDNRWGMFVDGNGIFAQANSANMLPGYQSESGGVTTGLTFKWNKNVATGLYAGYQGTYNKSGANGSGLGVGSTLIDNAVRFGLFGTYGEVNSKGEPLGFYANALAGGAYHNYQATRVIQYTGVNRTANSAPGAGELDSMLATGYDIQTGKFTFGPTASLQYTYLGANGVNETGAQSLNFSSSGWNSSSMLSSVGAHAAYNWVAHHGSGGDVVVVPQISLNWQHEFMQNPYAINGNLGGTSPSFSNWSATPIRDFLYTGVGFTVEFAKNWNTSFFYNASAGNSDLVSQNIFWSAGVKF
jgi:T5SS/PEP-CTERM-associated repeat protein